MILVVSLLFILRLTRTLCSVKRIQSTAASGSTAATQSASHISGAIMDKCRYSAHNGRTD